MSYAIPNPARIDVFPLVPGEYAKPTRGAQLFFCGFGSLNSRTPGTVDIALIVCCRMRERNRRVLVPDAQDSKSSSWSHLPLILDVRVSRDLIAVINGISGAPLACHVRGEIVEVILKRGPFVVAAHRCVKVCGEIDFRKSVPNLKV